MLNKDTDYDGMNKFIQENLTMDISESYAIAQKEYGYVGKRDTYRRILRARVLAAGEEPAGKKAKNPSGDVISPDEFLGEIDIPGKVLMFLDTVVGDSYIKDDKLRKQFEMSPTKWKEVAELSKFTNRRLSYGPGNSKQTIWSSVAGIAKAIDTISMARYDT